MGMKETERQRKRNARLRMYPWKLCEVDKSRVSEIRRDERDVPHGRGKWLGAGGEH